MPQSLPPEPPPILQPLRPEDIRLVSTTAPAPLSALWSVNVNTLSAPTLPETSSPSPLNVAKSAALLGSSVRVGYPLVSVETTNPSAASVTGPLQHGFITLRQTTPPQSQSQLSGQSQPPNAPPVKEKIIDLTSQRQEYDEQHQIVTAVGKVLLRFDGGVLNADRLQVNLQNLVAVAQGNVVLTRGQQVLRGQRFTYNFIQDTGEVLNAAGEINLPSTRSDFAGTLPTDVTAGVVAGQSPSDRLLANQPLQQVSSRGGIGVTVGGGRKASNISRPQQGGTIRRVRFQAERIDFYPGGWQASKVRITNDPFSPPELELRTDTATLTPESPSQKLLVTTRPRLVFDQGLTLPIPKNQATIGPRQRQVNATPVQIGYDATDKGGLFIERGFTAIDTNKVNLTLTPQFFIQKAIRSSSDVSGIFGLRAGLNSNLGPRTSVRGLAIVNGFDSNDLERRLRASLRLRQTIGTTLPHTLTLEYSYRDRLYNGSLGFQTVQSSVGGILTSPVIPLGKTGINLSYQLGAQYVNADTDRQNLLPPPSVRKNNRVSLSRFQGSIALNRGYLLWQGKALPATPTQGLKYTATPVVPSLIAFGGLTGVAGYYSSGYRQNSLTGTIGLVGNFGHFSRPYLDYTGFNLSYSQGIVSGRSPFLFDRYVDTKVLSAGFTQQIYGPIRFGLQTALNLDTGQQYSTDYYIEYSRRSYGIALRYNPDQRLGAITFRISDFNWSGGTEAFSGPEFEPVINGVPRMNE